jgi:hypothetical protein
MGAGALLGALYGLAGALTLRRAARADEQELFLRVFLGGLTARFTLAMLLLMLALLFAPVRGAVFAAAFMTIALAGVLGEVGYAYRVLAGRLPD